MLKNQSSTYHHNAPNPGTIIKLSSIKIQHAELLQKVHDLWII
jgi:hypothetical protein